MGDLGVEDLPGVAARLLKNDPAVFRVGVIPKIGAFVEESASFKRRTRRRADIVSPDDVGATRRLYLLPAALLRRLFCEIAPWMMSGGGVSPFRALLASRNFCVSALCSSMSRNDAMAKR
jgi:hypothetical protein